MANVEDDASNCQDIRIAVVMNGGVSLAVWISGVTLELHQLATARRADPAAYGPLLGLLDADARVDVIAGTSAGGLNGAFLALGVNHNRDLRLLRQLWRDVGGLADLLRDPLAKKPPSVLRGDDYFLPQIRGALGQLAGGGLVEPGERRPVDLILTGTLWDGRTTSFTDDMASTITEVDHDATFRFQSRPDTAVVPACGDLDAADGVLDRLASAARCTASFPAAFEPHWVSVGDADGLGDAGWASSAGRANFSRSQYVVDGGILLNKPIRPVLQAIYQLPAEFQVRRLLAYVAPGPASSPSSGPGPDATAPGPLPQAATVLLGVLTSLRATDSVSRELTEIRTRNAAASSRRRARDRFAAAMTAVADTLSDKAWDGYLDVRVDHAARTIGQLIAAGQVTDAGRWSESELVDVLRGLLPTASFVPRGPLAEAVTRTGDDWDWGTTTAQRLGDMALDVLKRAVWLAPLDSGARTAIVEARRDVSETIGAIRDDRSGLDRYWSTAATGAAGAIPPRVANQLGTAANRVELAGWLGTVLDGWEHQGDQSGRSRRTLLHQQVLDLARRLAVAASDIADVVARPNTAVDADGIEARRLKSLLSFLLAPSAGAPGPAAADVLARMLRLDVVQLSYEGASQDVEQEVELVQFAMRQPECITGLQVYHFGAFYRSSWRVNDWIHGRMDGAAHLVRTLLAPQRLRQRAGTLPAEGLLAAMRSCVVSAAADPADEPFLREQWAALAATATSYVNGLADGRTSTLDRLADGQAPAPGGLPDGLASTLDDEPRMLGRIAEAMTLPIHLAILREDLPSLAEAIRAEGDQAPDDSMSWLRTYDAAVLAAKPGPIAATTVLDLWTDAAKIGKEKITDEIGGDTLARTASHLAAVTVNAMGTLTRPKAVTSVLGALRGYTLTVWAMIMFLTSRDRFGKRIVQLAVAAGGSLLALAILVPAMPLALILAGIFLLVAGVSAAAALTPAGKGVGWRLGVAGIVVLAALSWYLYREWHTDGFTAVLGVLVKIGVFLLIVILGWWISTARPRRRRDRAEPTTRNP